MRKRKLGLTSTDVASRSFDSASRLFVRCWRWQEGRKVQNEDTKTEDGKNVKDTLVFGRGGDSTSLDPSRVTEGESFKVTVNLYETLLNFGEKDTDD